MLSPLWKITLFGGLRLENAVGDRIERFATQKNALLLCYLALNLRQPPQSRDVLAELLWPETAPEAARHNLRQALASLRRQLEPPGTPRGSILIAHGNQRIALNPDAVTVDTDLFLAALRDAAQKAGTKNPDEQKKAAERAIALYTGELLPGFYTDWVLLERARFAEEYNNVCDTLRRLETIPPTHTVPAAKPAVASTVTTPSETPSAPLRSPLLLPASLTRFFGRQEELERLETLLTDSQIRLITLTGTGGSGKTRLAIEAARQSADRFPGGIIFVPLADESTADRLPETVRAILAAGGILPPRSTAEPITEIAERFRGERTLFLLDNFEQLTDAGTPFVRALLERAPTITCIVTSRHSLNLLGERELPVTPLPTPPLPGTPARLLEFPSVQLFLDRAQSVRPDFQITERNAETMASLCRCLDGIPLAIELAAARARALAPAQILAHLEDRFAFLQSRDPNAPARHRTLFAAIDGSVRVLIPELRRFFLRLAVFRGGWTLEAAGSVAGHTEAAVTLEMLERLCQASLVVPTDAGDVVRFRMLETLREYALAEQEDAERQDAARAHALYFADFSEKSAQRLAGVSQAETLRSFDTERDNLRAARLTLEESGDIASLLRLVAGQAMHWVLRGEFREGRAILEATFRRTETLTGDEMPDAIRLRTRIADAVGAICAQSGDFAVAEQYSERSLSFSRALGDNFGIARSLNNLGSMAIDQNRFLEAETRLSEGIAYAMKTGNRQMLAAMRNNLALSISEQGRTDEAAALHEENLALRRELGDTRGVAMTLLNLADIYIQRQEGETASRLYREALPLFREIGDLPLTAIALEGLGEALLVNPTVANAEICARLFGAAEALRERTGAQRRPPFQAKYPDFERELREILGERVFRRQHEHGKNAPLEQILDEGITSFVVS